MTAKDKERLCLGVISGVHGIKGEVKITSFTQAPGDIAIFGPLEDETGARTFEITSARTTKGNTVVASLKDMTQRNQAEAVKGVKLFVARDLLPAADEGEWYYIDLIGLEAIGTDDSVFGRIISVQNFGAGDLLEIERADSKKTILLPFTQEAVPEVDIPGGKVTVSPPEGLLDDDE